MKNRCYNPKSQQYKNYGARGIEVCDAWRSSFDAFLSDMGLKPDGMTLDRFPDNDGKYEASNCRWATSKEQRRNQRTCHYLEHDGRIMLVRDWANELGMNELTLLARINTLKWDVSRALTTPVMTSRESARHARAAQIAMSATPPAEVSK